jgi:hypothetical protein
MGRNKVTSFSFILIKTIAKKSSMTEQSKHENQFIVSDFFKQSSENYMENEYTEYSKQ